MNWYGFYPSVCPSKGPQQQTHCCRFAAVEMLIDCCTAGAQQRRRHVNAGSATCQHTQERIIFKVATLMYRALHGLVPPQLTWRRHSHVSPTCHTDAGSGPPPLNSLTFRPVVGQLSEVVPFLLLEQRCGMACQAKLRRPRRCRCSRTG